MVWESNGRPFSPAEADRICEFADGLPERLHAAQKLEDSQKWLARQLDGLVAPRAAEWGLPKEPFTTDFGQALAAVAQAMLLDDPGLLRTGVVASFAGLADALDVPRADFGRLFADVWELLCKRLEARPQELLGPYFAAVSAGLGAAEPVAA
jgi:hypothetical protein